ncbi:MAG: regulator SirB [Gammaproteobacteria bacterium]|nr:MAG: regulator SirB [Gammaproteobacteria bacterium]
MTMLIKYIHVSCVVATFSLFFIRGLWMIRDSGLHQTKWARRIPPVIDTILLISATLLALNIKQYPFVDSWLTAKVIALFVYIGLGLMALTYGRTKMIRVSYWAAAQLVFIYIVLVALTKNPLIAY